MTDVTRKLNVLRGVNMFTKLPGEILFEIAQETGWQEISAGEIIFSEGDMPDGFYIVASGEVSIERNGQVLSLLKEGDFFGEIGVFEGLPRSASAIAKSEGMLLIIDNITFDNITSDCPEVMRALAGKIIEYIRAEHSK